MIKSTTPIRLERQKGTHTAKDTAVMLVRILLATFTEENALTFSQYRKAEKALHKCR